jgi:hypothetical protein
MTPCSDAVGYQHFRISLLLLNGIRKWILIEARSIIGGRVCVGQQEVEGPGDLTWAITRRKGQANKPVLADRNQVGWQPHSDLVVAGQQRDGVLCWTTTGRRDQAECSVLTNRNWLGQQPLYGLTSGMSVKRDGALDQAAYREQARQRVQSLLTGTRLDGSPCRGLLVAGQWRGMVH